MQGLNSLNPIVGKRKPNKLQNALLWIIPISPIFMQYSAPVLSYGMILMLICLIILLTSTRRIKVDKDLVLVATAITIQTCIVYTINHISVIEGLKTVLYVWCIVIITYISVYCMRKGIDYEKQYHVLKIVGGFLIGTVYIQANLFYLFGIQPGPIQILPLPEEALINWTSSSRPCGFFSEPSAFAGYSLIYQIISIEKKDYWFAVFVTIGIVLSGSSLGIIIAGLIWLYYLNTSTIKRQYKIIVTAAIFLLILLFMFMPQLETIREKVVSIFLDIGSYRAGRMINSFSYSNYLRTFKGWATFFELPNVTKLTGTGLNNFRGYIITHGLRFSWNYLWSAEDSMAGYFSSAPGVLIECGLIVGIIYYIFIFKKIRTSHGIGRMIMYLLVAQSFVGYVFFNSMFTFYLLMFYLYYKPKKYLSIGSNHSK